MNRFKYRPTVVVCGATGLQGGSVVKGLLASGKYHIRAITRNAESDEAESLRNLGVDIVVADYDQPTTLVRAFQDCQLAFIVTNFWEHMDAKREYRQGCTLMDAAEEAGIIHVVWSTLEDTRANKYNDEIPLIGDYKVAHFDEKGRITEYAKTKRFQRTDLYTSFYYENFLTTMKIVPDNDGIRRLYLPIGNRPIPMVSINDIGQMVVKVLDQGILGEVGVSSEHLTGRQIAERLSDATGKSYEYVAVSPDDYRNLGFPGCQELGNMFEFKSRHNGDFCRRRHLNQVTQHYSPEHFMSWCQKNCGKLLTETPG